ncbi:MAG TPA: ABC transporter permease subunit [Candidatus Angelobacter sp.]|nr:ABC transporter permease subunit [Candidatus Angelobacter sp.]
MKRINITYIVFGLLGGLLLIDLVLPVASLMFNIEWATWGAALRHADAIKALKVSVVSSLLTVAIMALLGIPAAYVLARTELPFKRLWISLIFLPLVVPDLAGGILLLQTFGPYGIVGGSFEAQNIRLTNNLAGIVLAQLFVAAPFVIISALAGFRSVDTKLEWAAATLGDSRWEIFRRVSLPLAWPGIASGLMLGWIRALGEFGSTLIMAYNPHTLPVYMWVKFESDGLRGALPTAFCLVSMAVIAVAVSMLISRLTGYADVVPPLSKAMTSER